MKHRFWEILGDAVGIAALFGTGWLALVITDIPDHELNGEDSKLDYLRTMQQKASSFCRYRNIRVKTRRVFDEEPGLDRLWIRREPDPDQEP